MYRNIFPLLTFVKWKEYYPFSDDDDNVNDFPHADVDVGVGVGVGVVLLHYGTYHPNAISIVVVYQYPIGISNKRAAAKRAKVFDLESNQGKRKVIMLKFISSHLG